MIQFIVRRLLTSLVVLVLITLMVFASQRLLPGDPVRVWAGEEQDSESLAFFRHKYGLDQPISMQYLTWLGLALRVISAARFAPASRSETKSCAAADYVGAGVLSPPGGHWARPPGRLSRLCVRTRSGIMWVMPGAL